MWALVIADVIPDTLALNDKWLMKYVREKAQICYLKFRFKSYSLSSE